MNQNKIIILRIIISICIFLPLFILHFILDIPFWVILPLSIFAYLIIGYDILYKSFRNILHGQFLDENFLMSIATIGAFIIQEFLEAVAVMIFYQIGELFQDYAVNRSRKSISELMNIRPEKANLIQNGEEIVVEPEDVNIGDILVVKVGEKIPLDGLVVEGKSSLDTKALTGEAIPRDIDVGSEVLSGCINIGSVFKIQATKVYFDSTVSKILDLVENVSGKKAKAENFITKFARFYTPIVVFLAILLAIIPPIINGAWGTWVFRALTFLVVSCPCALVISVPLGFFCGIGGASRAGILIKGGSYLELLNKTNVFVFDKTGTLTKGNFEVVSIESENYTKEEVLELAAIVESQSNHPIAKSIVNAYSKPTFKNIEVSEFAGFGMIAQVDKDRILVGNAKLMEKYQIVYKENKNVGTTVYVAKNDSFVGSILIADQIKEDTLAAISKLNELGCKTIMLTGDQEKTAKDIAGKLHISEYYAELLPQNKVEKVEEILNHKNKKDVVAFVGDGINDAPVIMRSDVGISMGGVGSDSAIEASDVVLMYDNLSGILIAKRIAKKTIRIIMENIIFAIGIKIFVLGLSAFGVANMWLAILADVGVCVVAILNAMRCSHIKKE